MNWGDIPTWLGILGAIVVFVLGRREYRTAQHWKRSEFLAAEIDAFFAAPRVATALLLIDYSVIRLDREGRRVPQDSAESLLLTDQIMASALRIHTEFPDETESFDAAEMLAREAFDEILTWFERFQHHIRIGLINSQDTQVYLGYWVEKFADPRSGWKPAAFYAAVSRFVDAYQYRGASELFRSFGSPLQNSQSSPPAASGLDRAQTIA
jgi:hypothetical protein